MDWLSYPEQAVDGEEAEQRSGEVGGFCEDGGHLLEHHVLRLRARLVVGPELRVGLRHRRRRATQDCKHQPCNAGES